MGYSIKDVIVDGIKGELQYTNSDTFKQRIEICNICDYNKVRTCTKCGCLVDLKARMTKSSCPMGKW